LKSDTTLAHEHCSLNREELYRSERCGCFFCCQIFTPQEIESWVGGIWIENDQEGPTALCPHCGIDAVIGSASGFPITRNFLELMQARWF
jgi:hypothetical protein